MDENGKEMMMKKWKIKIEKNEKGNENEGGL